MTRWPIIRLDECCEIISGATPSTGTASYWDGDICWATPRDLSGLPGPTIDDTPRKITPAGLKSCGATLLPVGSVLFSSRAPIGHVAINTRPMATNQGFKSFIPNPRRLVPGYLYHWLRCNRSYIEGLGNGATFKEVSKAVVSRIEIPTPPVPEQRRIATILDHADALRVKRRVALAQLDEMAQAIFLEMFGDLHTNPRRWPVVPVSRYVEAFQGGKSLEADGEESGGRYRVLKISAVTGMFFKASESKPLSDIYVPPQTHFVRSGDLLFSRANTTELVGAIAYVDYAPANLLLPDKLWRFVWRSPTSVEPLFIWELFQTPAIREEIGRRATGTSGSMKNISQEKLLAMNTILPPLPLQKEFVKRLSAVRRVNENFLDSAKQLDTLFASLQHRAFNGEL